MFIRALIVLPLVFAVGCNATVKQSPFAGLFSRFSKKSSRIDPNAPPRKTFAEQSDDDAPEVGRSRIIDGGISNSEIALTEFVPGAEGVRFTESTVVARVNGKPVFAEDVLQPKAGEFKKAAEKLSPEELNRLKAMFIRNNLKPHIEQAVLVTALKNDVTRAEWTDLNAKVRELFDQQEIERLKGAFKVNTRVELERKLAEQGTSIDKLRESFSDQQLAVYYIKDNTKPKQVQYSRKELIAAYEKNIEQYRISPRAKWRQVRINYRKGSQSSQDKAIAKMREAVNMFRQKASFADIARKYSDGPNASAGGVWDWTEKDSLAEEAINKALFQLSPGQPSQVLDTGSAFVIVEVLKREDGGFRSFDEVQDEINKKLQQGVQQDDTGKFIDELVANATIQTLFDGPTAPTPGLE